MGVFCSPFRGPAPPGPPFLFGLCFPCPLFGFWSVPWFLPCCDSFVLFLSVCVSACCFAVVFSAASVCLLWCCWVSVFAVFVVLCGGSPPPLAVVSLPPFGCSLAASWSRYCAGPSLWVSGCFMRRPGCLALMLGVLWCFASSLHLASWQQRPLALCGVFCYPLHHGAVVVGVLCAPALRYSSSDDPGPPLDTAKLHTRHSLLQVWHTLLLSFSAFPAPFLPPFCLVVCVCDCLFWRFPSLCAISSTFT